MAEVPNRQIRWYKPDQEPAVTRREFSSLPKHGQAALAELVSRFKRNKERAAEVDSHQKGIYELRVRVDGDIFRALYFKDSPCHFVIVRIFQKKSQKTPLQEIRLAIQRRNSWRNAGGSGP